MQFQLTTLFLTALLSSTALAGWNCKCQTSTDKGGVQYDSRTQAVCAIMKGDKRDEINKIVGSVAGSANAIATLPLPGGPEVSVGIQVATIVSQWAGAIFSDAKYHGNQHHQCSSAGGQLDSGKFVQVCTAMAKEANTPAGMGAYCWK